MKTLLMIVLFAIPAAGLRAQVTLPPAPHMPKRSALPIELENQWTSALIRRDPQTFERLLAPGFIYTEDAAILSRADVIRSVTGPDHVTWARNERMNAHDFGDVHVVVGVLHLRGRGKDGPFDRQYRYTDVWQRKNGTWQIIAAQDYLIPR